MVIKPQLVAPPGATDHRYRRGDG